MLKMYSVPAQIEACYNAETEAYDLEAIKAVKMETKAKACCYIAVIKNLAGEEAAISTELERLKAMLDRRKRNKESLLAGLKFGMEALGFQKVTDGVHTAKIVNNSRPSIDITDKDAVPAKFKTESIDIKVDRNAILQQVKETGEIPDGVEVRQGNHVRIS